VANNLLEKTKQKYEILHDKTRAIVGSVDEHMRAFFQWIFYGTIFHAFCTTVLIVASRLVSQGADGLMPAAVGCLVLGCVGDTSGSVTLTLALYYSRLHS